MSIKDQYSRNSSCVKSKVRKAVMVRVTQNPQVMSSKMRFSLRITGSEVKSGMISSSSSIWHLQPWRV
jgi:hypothetical protein